MNSGTWEITPALITILESGDRGLVRELLAIFLGNTREAIEKLVAGAPGEMAAESHAVLHGLKTGCAQFGAKDLARLALQAELSMETNDFNGAFLTVTEMAKRFPDVVAEVELFLAASEKLMP